MEGTPAARDTGGFERGWWRRTSPLAWLPLLLIRVYQLLLSPWLGPTCRFEPSCSRYAVACLVRFGLVRGGLLAGWRLVRCQPLHPGGYEPPPDRWPVRWRWHMHMVEGR